MPSAEYGLSIGVINSVGMKNTDKIATMRETNQLIPGLSPKRGTEDITAPIIKNTKIKKSVLSISWRVSKGNPIIKLILTTMP